ncbi:CBASS oligonucleotide cyclase [Amycolatopsis sp. 3B14]|uniref:CBASS oligonucleotide cyclase n=1 Tax=Amycolatopsis sp. 3B14 TaxID=3243600 RepID=UPI003D998E72
MSDETYVTHAVLKRFAENRINVPSEAARKRREQVNHLRARLEAHIAAHPDYDLVKLRASGSTAKHTAIRTRNGAGSDADVAAYLRSADPEIDEAKLLDWLCQRCQEVYGKTKVADDFVISQHAVGITLRGSGLKVDVAPVLYTGEDDDKGFLVTRQGQRVLTSVTLHLRFIGDRRKAAGPGYTELIRLLKAWIREAKSRDPYLRCKSFLLELVVAHLWDTGWNGHALQVEDYPAAFEQVLAYIATTGLQTPIAFSDFYSLDQVLPNHDSIQIWDPVNPENNVASSYTDADRRKLVDAAASALDSVNWAAMAPTQGAAYDAWRDLFGPTFPGA